MKKLYTLIIVCILFTLSIPVSAQTDAKKGEKISTTDEYKTETKPVFSKFSLDLSAGTRGLGIGGRYKISNHFSVRAGFSTMPLTYSSTIWISGYNSKIDLTNDFEGIQLFGQYKFSEKIPVQLIFGFADFFVAKFDCKLEPITGDKIGLIGVTPEEVGTVSAKVDWSGIAPFIGLGIGSRTPKHHIGFALGLGIYFLPAPKVTVSGTNFLSTNDLNQPWLADNVKDYRYLPVLNFHLIYRFKKTNK